MGSPPLPSEMQSQQRRARGNSCDVQYVLSLDQTRNPTHVRTYARRLRRKRSDSGSWVWTAPPERRTVNPGNLLQIRLISVLGRCGYWFNSAGSGTSIRQIATWDKLISHSIRHESSWAQILALWLGLFRTWNRELWAQNGQVGPD